MKSRPSKAHVKSLFGFVGVATFLYSLWGFSQTPVQTEPVKSELEKHLEPINQKLQENLLDRASVYASAGKLQEALADYEAVSRINPENPVAAQGISTIFVSQKKYSDAISTLSKVIDQKGAKQNLSDVLAMRGVAYAKLKEEDKALQDFNKALQLNYENPMANNNLAWLEATATKKEIRNGSDAIKRAHWAVSVAKGRLDSALASRLPSTDAKRALAYAEGTLAAAYAEYGSTSGDKNYLGLAPGWQKSANQRFEELKDVEPLKLGQDLLKRYEEGKPYHGE